MTKPSFTLCRRGLLVLLALALPAFCHAETIHDELVVVPAHKLPAQAAKPSEAMELYSVTPDTLYLYLEQDQGQNLAIFDVSDARKMELKGVERVSAHAAFDFVEAVGKHTLLIRYRDGSGDALLDLSRPKHPSIKPMDSSATESYVLPTGGSQSKSLTGATRLDESGQDYRIMVPASTEPAFVIHNVIQQKIDEGNGAIYLLRRDGLTVIRNVKRERQLAAMGPSWTNTID